VGTYPTLERDSDESRMRIQPKSVNPVIGVSMTLALAEWCTSSLVILTDRMAANPYQKLITI
jgi:hypothetical protein